MNAIDVLGLVGEVISWVGAVVGLPLLATAVIIRTVGGRRRPTPAPGYRFCMAIGATMIGAAALGFVLSLLPLFR